jgi:DNA-binding MarR family transcriptional regulator
VQQGHLRKGRRSSTDLGLWNDLRLKSHSDIILRVGRRCPMAHVGNPISGSVVRQLAWCRYQIRRSLRFGEQMARACGETPRQQQLLLGVAGYTGRGWATISELAEFLQERHNSVVELVDRSVQRDLVHKQQDFDDLRFIRVRLASRGRRTLEKLAQPTPRGIGAHPVGDPYRPQNRPRTIQRRAGSP